MEGVRTMAIVKKQASDSDNLVETINQAKAEILEAFAPGKLVTWSQVEEINKRLIVMDSKIDLLSKAVSTLQVKQEPSKTMETEKPTIKTSGKVQFPESKVLECLRNLKQDEIKHNGKAVLEKLTGNSFTNYDDFYEMLRRVWKRDNSLIANRNIKRFAESVWETISKNKTVESVNAKVEGINYFSKIFDIERDDIKEVIETVADDKDFIGNKGKFTESDENWLYQQCFGKALNPVNEFARFKSFIQNEAKNKAGIQ